MQYWVYILNCTNDTYYTGYTTDIKRRYQEHLAGSAKCKYTRSFKPLGIAQLWRISGDKTVAMQAENFIKKLPKHKKTYFINHPTQLAGIFPSEPDSLRF